MSSNINNHHHHHHYYYVPKHSPGRYVICLCVLLFTSGCYTEWKVVEPEEDGKVSKLVDGTGRAAELVIENEDGSVTLQSFIPAHLINNMRKCLMEGDYELLYDQILSDEIKQAYISRGLDPREMLVWFEENQRDLLIFLSRMSAGISAPHIVHQTQGNRLTMSVYGRIAQGLRFKTAELIQSRGQFRLYMIR